MTTTDEDEWARAGIAWWNGLTEDERRYWMSRAGNTGVAADAYAAYCGGRPRPAEQHAPMEERKSE